ncbi:pentapeptide repeat-containing protein [Streptomyces alboniger]|uniref:Pentapeptide repeat-containing protein n=1 Tax=Streptomyces alboniger TaxID=132473 RepID=A0A5J6HVU4_STRAD|nr:pentapeptide repeat-containing protein [Streptomyces alboniger]QEV21107.1 pentapeptide repeat-containing protein [Streptomyces alboniger]
MPRHVRIKAPGAPRSLPVLRPAVMPGDDWVDDTTVKGVRYEGAVIAGRSAEAVEAERCRFENTRFTGTELRRAVLSDSYFETCDFAQVRARDVSLIRCAVTSSRLTGSSWAPGTFRDVRFEACRSDLALFRYSKFNAVVFADCNMQGADFQSAEFNSVRFVNCGLRGAQFSHAVMQNVRFENCDLGEVNGAKSFRGATVQGPGSMDLALLIAHETGVTIEA